MQKRVYSKWVVGFIVALAVIAYISLGIRFGSLSILSKAVMTILLIGILLYSYHRSLEEFYLTLLSGGSIFLALVNSFGRLYAGDSPLSLKIALGPWALFLITFILTALVLLWYEKSRYKDKFPLILLVVFVFVWIVLAFNTTYFSDWKMENWLTVPFIIFLYIIHRWFRLSNLSYGLIFAFMTLHIVGSHYTYAEVPFGYWLSSFLGLGRNQYDRIVHFSFGLLMAYPMREVVIRIGQNKGFWGLYVPVEFVLATSCVYELFEWGVAVMFGGDLGIAYLGSQGDVWDAQKDMAVAGLGSVVAMFVVFLVHMVYNSRSFWKEFKESFHVKKKMLGERVINKWIK